MLKNICGIPTASARVDRPSIQLTAIAQNKCVFILAVKRGETFSVICCGAFRTMGVVEETIANRRSCISRGLAQFCGRVLTEVSLIYLITVVEVSLRELQTEF